MPVIFNVVEPRSARVKINVKITAFVISCFIGGCERGGRGEENDADA